MTKLYKFSLIIIIAFSLWIVRDLFKDQFFSSHDGYYHVLRLNEFNTALSNGQFPVRWAPTLNQGIGYPLFVINYHLPYYFAEIFVLLGMSTFWSIKITFIIAFVATSTVAFSLFRNWLKNDIAALTGAIFFSISPYRLANIFERGALGEVFAYIFIPLLFISIDKLIKEKKTFWLTLSLAGLILSHAIVAIIFFPLVLVYLLVFSNDLKQDVWLASKSSFLSVLICSFQLFPALFERSYMKFDSQLLDSYKGHFKSFYQLLRIPKEGINIGSRFQVGLSHSLVFLAAIFAVIVSKTKSKQAIIFIVTVFLSFFLILRQSLVLWNFLLPLKFILYPWRILGIISFTTSFLAAYLVNRVPKFTNLAAIILISLGLYTNRHYFKVDKLIPSIIPKSLAAGNATTENEFDPIYFSNRALEVINPRVESLFKQSLIKEYKKKPFYWTAVINNISSKQDLIKFSLLFYPGWQVEVNNQAVKPIINYRVNQVDYSGLIVVPVQSGQSKVKIKLSETPIRKAGNTISLLSFALAIIKKRS